MRRLLSVATVCVALLSAGAADAQVPAGTWTTGPPLPTARSEDSVAVIGSTIYVIGGYAAAGANPGALDSTGRVDVDQPLVQALDVVTGRWTNRAPLPRGLNHVGVAVFGAKVYAFGGFTKQNREPVADANVYDPATNTWTALPPLPAPLGSISVAVATDGKLHLIGGRDVHSVATHTVFDPATKTYTSAAPLPVGRDHMGLVAFADKLYAIAGRIDDFNHNTSYVDVYDPKTGRWTSGKPMPSQRSGSAVAIYHGRILVIGGEYGGGAYTNNEAYDPGTDSWTTLTPLPEGRHGTGAAVFGNSLYVPAGAPVNGGSRQTDTLLVYRES